MLLYLKSGRKMHMRSNNGEIRLLFVTPDGVGDICKRYKFDNNVENKINCLL